MLSPQNAPAGCGSIQAEIYFSQKYHPLDRPPESFIEPVIHDLKRCSLINEDDRILCADARLIPYANTIFDLDIHFIPEYRQTPGHHHYDIRYLFLADDTEDIAASNESKEVKWWDLDSIPPLVNDDRSIIRMIEKSYKLAELIRNVDK